MIAQINQNVEFLQSNLIHYIRVVLFFHQFIDDASKKALQKLLTPSHLLPNDDDNNLESIVKIMVESPKEPPNIEFGVASPQTTVVREKTETTTTTNTITDSNTTTTTTTITTTPEIQSTACSTLQDPIDVNTPRDTANIFYAYEETDTCDDHMPSPLVASELDRTTAQATNIECSEQNIATYQCDSDNLDTDRSKNESNATDS